MTRSESLSQCSLPDSCGKKFGFYGKNHIYGFFLFFRVMAFFFLLLSTSVAVSAQTANGIMQESWGATDSDGNALTFAIITTGQPTPAQYRTISSNSLTVQSYWATGFAKASGWIVAPETGYYVFTLNGTNRAEIFLSTDNTTANKKSLATIKAGAQSTSSIYLLQNTQYYYEVYLQSNRASDQVSLGWTLPDGTKVSAIPDQDLIPNTNVGGVLWEFWNDIPDQALSALLTSEWYPNEPVTRFLTSGSYPGEPTVPSPQIPVFEMFTTVEWSGSRLRGYLQAPETGTYYFSVSGDDESALLFSPTLDPNLATVVAAVPDGAYTGFRQWNEYSAQQSGPITLQAGQWYYVEAQEKNGHGTGHVSVGWTLPDGTFEGPIPAWRLNPVSAGRLGNLPTVRLTSPSDGSSFVEGNSVQVAATITSPDSPITQATLFSDGTAIASLFGPSYQATIPSIAAGNHTLSVQATDAFSESAHDQVGIYAFPALTTGNLGLTNYEQQTQTFTTPGSSEITAVNTVAAMAGSAFSATSAPGDWTQSGNSLISNAVQGWVQYQVNITSPDVYRVVIQASAIQKASPSTLFTLGVMIDGVQTDTVTLPSGTVNVPNDAVTYTPWLSAGQHNIRLIWQNYTMQNVISINGLAFQELAGPSTNGNGTTDWVQGRFQNMNSITIAAPTNQVSPACIEGTVNTFADMSISNGVIPQKGIKTNWYANVPLQPTQPTQVSVSFENGAYQLQKSISWAPTNLLLGGSVTIRAGDSLLFTASDSTNSSSVPVTIQVPGQAAINTTNSQPVPVLFSQAGTYKVTGSYYAAYPQNSSYNSSTGTTFTYTVTVVAANFGVNPIAWNTRPRVWDCPNIPPSVYVEADPSVQLTKTTLQPTVGTQFSALTTNPVDSYVVARLAPGGPILANAAVRGFWLQSSDQAYLNTVQVYPDGSAEVEMDIVVSLITSDESIVLQTDNSAVLFSDGTVEKTLTAANFDSHNTCKVFFIISNTGASICHTLTVYQGGAYVGTR